GGAARAPGGVRAAGEAMGALGGRRATRRDEMAGDRKAGPAPTAAGQRLSQARAIGGEIRHVDRALTEAEESLRLNPRKRWIPYVSSALRDGLETLEHAATTVRGIARSIGDETRAGDGVLPGGEAARRGRRVGVGAPRRGGRDVGASGPRRRRRQAGRRGAPPTARDRLGRAAGAGTAGPGQAHRSAARRARGRGGAAGLAPAR